MAHDHIPSKRKELHHPGIMEIHAPSSSSIVLLPSHPSQSSWTPPLSADSTASSPSTLTSALMWSSRTHSQVLDENANENENENANENENENENKDEDASETAHRSKRRRDNYFSVDKDDHDMSIVIPETDVVIISNSPSPSPNQLEEGNKVQVDDDVQFTVDQEETRHYQLADQSIQRIETDSKTPAVAIERSRLESSPRSSSEVQEVVKEAKFSTPPAMRTLEALSEDTSSSAGDLIDGAQKSIETMKEKDMQAASAALPKKNDAGYDPKTERDVSIKTVVKPHDAEVKAAAVQELNTAVLLKDDHSPDPELPFASRVSRRTSSSLPIEAHPPPLAALNHVLPRETESRADTNAADKENKQAKDAAVHYPLPDFSEDVRHRRVSTAPPSVISIQSEDSVYFVPKPSTARKKAPKESAVRTMSQAESQNAAPSRATSRRASTTATAPQVIDIVGMRSSTRRSSQSGNGENPDSAVCIQSEDDDDDVIVLDVRRPGPRAPGEYPLSDNFVRAPGVPRLRDFALPSLQRLSSRSASVIRKRSRQQSSRLGSLESQDDQTDTDRYGEDTIRLDDDVWEDQLDEWHPYAQGAIQLINSPEWIPNNERSQDSETGSRSFSFFTDRLTPPPPPPSSVGDAGTEERQVMVMKSPSPRISRSRARSPITFPGTEGSRSNRSSPVAVAPAPVPLILPRNGRAAQPQFQSEMKSLSPVQSPPPHSQNSRPQRFGPLPLLIKR